MPRKEGMKEALSIEDALGNLETWLDAPGSYAETIPWLAAIHESADYPLYREMVSTRASVASATIDVDVDRFRGLAQRSDMGAPPPQGAPGGQWGAPPPQGAPGGQWGAPPPQGAPGGQWGAPPPQGAPGGQWGAPPPQGAPGGQWGAPPPQGAPGGQWGAPGHGQAHYPLARPGGGSLACARCNSAAAPIVTSKVTTAGWVVFAVLALTFTCLCWIPLVTMKETEYRCPHCRALR